MALFAFLCSMVQWAFDAKHHESAIEYDRFLLAMGRALFSAWAFGILYLALEPYVRRRLPRTLITWTRLLGGRWRDALASGHILIGIAVGVGLALVFYVGNLAVEPYGSSRYGPGQLELDWLPGSRSMASILLDLTTQHLGHSLGFLFIYFLFYSGLRREWLATVVLVTLLAIFYGLQSSNFVPGTLLLLFVAGWVFLVLTRYGVVAFTALGLTSHSLHLCPMTTDLGAWYAGRMLVMIGAVAAVAVYAFVTALGGRRLLKDGFLEG